MAVSEGFEPSVPCDTPVFKTGTFDQLSQLTTIQSGANGRNRTDTPLPERDFKSRASTYSATLAHAFMIIKIKGNYIFKQLVFKLDWNYSD